MARATSQQPGPGAGEPERYPLKGASAFMMTRTAERQAQFFLPHLQANMSLLDCGCGPGSITLGLAKVVAPGETVGIDVNADDIRYAQAYAAEQEMSNLRFETADVYALPFPDGSFNDSHLLAPKTSQSPTQPYIQANESVVIPNPL